MLSIEARLKASLYKSLRRPFRSRRIFLKCSIKQWKVVDTNSQVLGYLLFSVGQGRVMRMHAEAGLGAWSPF